MNVLVTGGAGYIGSFMTKRLLDEGHKVVVFDNLERGYKEAIDKRAKFVQGDIKNVAALESLFSNGKIDAVMHFAGYISVKESMIQPDLYYKNNLVGSKNLFDSAINIGRVTNLIFSSSAAVYGNPIKVPIPEDHPKNPINPYGKNKLEVEEMLSFYHKKHGLSFVSLRYFNAAGAALDGSMGEAHEPETHIVPLAIKAVLTNSEFNLYGTDYDTPDGTCIRDYIHVVDLVEAHVLALDKLQKDKGGFFYNVGTGKGHSNKEVLETVEKISGSKIDIEVGKRRGGDVQTLIADPARIVKELGFKHRYSELEKIVETAWKWHKRNSKFIHSASSGQNSKLQ